MSMFKEKINMIDGIFNDKLWMFLFFLKVHKHEKELKFVKADLDWNSMRWKQIEIEIGFQNQSD